MIRTYASAGAVVTTNDLQQPTVLLLDQVRKTGERQTVAPKGRLEPGEAPLLAATREVAEETGISDSRYAAYLGRDSYDFVDNDGVPATKTVDWFLFTTTDTTTSPRLEEGFVGCRWLEPSAARRSVTHAQFDTVLGHAFDILTWRSQLPLAFSPRLADFVEEVAGGASELLIREPGTGLGLCGSAARGDFVEGWSDVDFIAWGVRAGSEPATSLLRLVGQAAEHGAIRASLHFVDAASGDARRSGPLYEMKVRAVVRRIGIDVPVIAGSVPTRADPTPETRADLSAVRLRARTPASPGIVRNGAEGRSPKGAVRALQRRPAGRRQPATRKRTSPPLGRRSHAAALARMRRRRAPG